MKTTIGGDRLGSGNKQNVSMRNYERSTHDLSYLWRSSMAAGTLVPFMNKVALPGDSFDIDLECEVLTLPTIGPLFGSYKVQLDVFQVPIRLYNAALHMNKLGIGMDMSSVYLPYFRLTANAALEPKYADDAQVNNSALIKYLGVSGIGSLQETGASTRNFNGVPYLGYWDIYKNYYANKQEERGFCLHVDNDNVGVQVRSAWAYLLPDGGDSIYLFDNPVSINENLYGITIVFDVGIAEPDPVNVAILRGGVLTNGSVYANSSWDALTGNLKLWNPSSPTTQTVEVETQTVTPFGTGTDYKDIGIRIKEFDLNNIDTAREKILQAPTSVGFNINDINLDPYEHIGDEVTINGQFVKSVKFSQANLGLKTYQSDLFNNWISTEWIDGANGINAVTAVDTTGDSFTIDALNLANKVYTMLNRIAISGGTYDDWLDAVYTHERARSIESPVYLGSLIKELAFESVISNAESGEQPLGQLAGRGKLTPKNKGGRIKAKIDEPSYIMGIVSLTPRIDYSQGNEWHVGLMTMNDFHKPALDAIGYQDLITEQMAWQSTEFTTSTQTAVQKSAGKQPAWINYMTAVNKTYGNFADVNKEMFMTLNRRYDIDQDTGDILDLTTYIDPTKFNQIFADTNLDAQNFWVQISANVIARRKMSAKVIPNL